MDCELKESLRPVSNSEQLPGGTLRLLLVTWWHLQWQDFSSPWFFHRRSDWERTPAQQLGKSVPLYPAGSMVTSAQPFPHHDLIRCALHMQSTCKYSLVKNFNERKWWRGAVICAEERKLQQQPHVWASLWLRPKICEGLLISHPCAPAPDICKWKVDLQESSRQDMSWAWSHPSFGLLALPKHL